MKIAFAGDVVLAGDLLDSDMSPLRLPAWEAADARIVNLEHPISDHARPIKTGMLHAPTRALKPLTTLGVTAVSLANNHIHDMGTKGIADTRAALAAAGIAGFGAGQTIAQARAPLWLDERLCVLAYCDTAPHMHQVWPAGDDAPGVNPLRLEAIMADLQGLRDDQRAILFLHWGRENVWHPPACDVALARRLLAEPKVALIVASHAHRLQGALRRNGKRAFMGLGNFLVPNFFLGPRFTLVPRPAPGSVWRTTTLIYNVAAPTYITWRRANRQSGIVVFDSDTGEARLHTAVQAADAPRLAPLAGPARAWLRARTGLLGAALALPAPLYRLVAGLNALWSAAGWHLHMAWMLSCPPAGDGGLKPLAGLTWLARRAGLIRRRKS